MQTEEDTFNRLKRISIEDLSIIIDRLPEADFHLYNDDREKFQEFLKPYGWTPLDFAIAVKELYAN